MTEDTPYCREAEIVGLFDEYLNHLLAGRWDRCSGIVQALMANPTFEKLRALLEEQRCFEGIITLRTRTGDKSYLGHVRQVDGLAVFFCEQDAAELDKINREITAISTRLNDLNRTLTKKDLLLEDAFRKLENQNAELHEERARADTANRAKSEFLAGMSDYISKPIRPGKIDELLAKWAPA